MSIIKNVNGRRHDVRVKLYHNHLPEKGGAYIAKTNNEASLTIGDVCAALKERGGFTGNYKALVENVDQFFDEMAYQLCDGFSVNTGYFSIHPNIGGTFDSVHESHDHKKHPITFRFRTMSKLRRLVEYINVAVEGMANVTGFIDEFLDYDEHAVNSTFLPENMFCISGHKIKVVGDDPSCGVYFVPEDDPSQAVKVTRIAENNPAKVSGIAPNTGFIKNKIVIRTQFSGSGSILLKAPRVITSDFVIEAA